MLHFKIGQLCVTSTLMLSLIWSFTEKNQILDYGLGILCLASGTLVSKILYDRHQQIHILSALTINPNVTSYSNKIASFSASFLCLGFLVYMLLFLFKVDDYCRVSIGILICGFETLYIWMQNVITTYISTLYYDKYLTMLRNYLAKLSILVLIATTVFGIAASVLTKNDVMELRICFVATKFCMYTMAAVFCIFLMTYEKEYKYFAEGLRSNLLLDDDSMEDTTISYASSLFGSQESSCSYTIKREFLDYSKVS